MHHARRLHYQVAGADPQKNSVAQRFLTALGQKEERKRHRQLRKMAKTMRKTAKEKLKKKKLANLAESQRLARAAAKTKRNAEIEEAAKKKALQARYFTKEELAGKNKKDEEQCRQARHDFLERLLVVHGPLQPDQQLLWSSFRTQLVDATFKQMNRSTAAELLLEARAKIQRKIKNNPQYLGVWVEKMRRQFLGKEKGALL